MAITHYSKVGQLFDISKNILVHLLTQTDKWDYLWGPIIEIFFVSCFDFGEVPRSPVKWIWNWLSFLPFILIFEQCELSEDDLLGLRNPIMFRYKHAAHMLIYHAHKPLLQVCYEIKLSHRMRYQSDEMHFDREGKRKTSKHKHHNKSSALIYLWDIKVMKFILTPRGKEKQVNTNINITKNLLLSTANDFNSHSTFTA